VRADDRGRHAKVGQAWGFAIAKLTETLESCRS